MTTKVSPKPPEDAEFVSIRREANILCTTIDDLLLLLLQLKLADICIVLLGGLENST